MAVEMNQETPITKYNIYCDESSVDNNLPFFTIGAFLLPRKRAKTITDEFKTIKKEYEFHRELKWNKVTELYLDMYKKLIHFLLTKQTWISNVPLLRIGL